MRIVAFILLLAFNGSAATYYIDYSGGNDANNGTAKATPWKHCPQMEPFAGSYSHSNGDRFIFKGGVTWPNTALPLYISTGGSAGSVDYYGTDQTWYTGGSFSKPVFDGEQTPFTNWTGNRQNVIQINGCGYVQIDNIEMKNYMWLDELPASISESFAVYCSTANNVTVSEVYAHDWVVKTNRDDKFGGFGNFNSTVLVASNCIVVGPTVIDPAYVDDAGYTSSGCGTYDWNTIVGCDFSHVSQGIFNGNLIVANKVHDGGRSFRSAEHENAINVMSTSWINRNAVYNWQHGTCIYLYGGWVTGGSTNYSINNIVWNCGVSAFNIETDNNDETKNGASYIYNNASIGTLFVQASERVGIPPIPTVDCRNNFWITNGTSSLYYWPSPTPNKTLTNIAVMNYTDALTYGISTNNLLKPTNFPAAILNTGAILSVVTNDFDRRLRPVGAYDIGAYEYGTNVPNTVIQGPVKVKGKGRFR